MASRALSVGVENVATRPYDKTVTGRTVFGNLDVNRDPAPEKEKLRDCIKTSAWQPLPRIAAEPVHSSKVVANDAPSDSRYAEFRHTLRFAEPEASPMDLDGSSNDQKYSLVEVDSDPEFLYDADVYAYLRSFEARTRPVPNYLADQPALTAKMRAILVDWLVEVALEYGLHEETLFAAVGFVDRFLSTRTAKRDEFQLLGTVACYVAAKVVEIDPPEIDEFVYITDRCYSDRQIRLTELLLLRVLDFEVNVPTPLDFLRRFNEWAGSDATATSLSGYLAELALVDAGFILYAPSTLAAAAVSLARHSLGYEAWPGKVADLSGIAIDDVKNCVKDLFCLYSSASEKPQQTVRVKYSNVKHGEVAHLSPPVSLFFNDAS